MLSRFRIWWLFKRMEWGLSWQMARFAHPVLSLMTWFGK